MRYAVVRAPRRRDGHGVNFATSEREQISSGGEGGRWNEADFDLDWTSARDSLLVILEIFFFLSSFFDLFDTLAFGIANCAERISHIPAQM